MSAWSPNMKRPGRARLLCTSPPTSQLTPPPDSSIMRNPWQMWAPHRKIAYLNMNLFDLLIWFIPLKEAPGLRAQKDELLGLIFNLTGKACHINSASMMIERNTKLRFHCVSALEGGSICSGGRKWSRPPCQKARAKKLKNTNIEKLRQYLFNWVFNTMLKHMFQFKKFWTHISFDKGEFIDLGLF